MSKIICKAYFLKPAADTIIAVSPSFQAALSPWILTLSAERYQQIWSTTAIKYFSLSPTFQYTRGLCVYFEDEADQLRFMNTDLCAPLFSHLQTLKVSYSQSIYTVRFEHGNAVANFILKFQRLQKFELHLHPESTPPSELINFYVRLFHSQSITQTTLVSVVWSYACNINECCSREKRSEYCALIKEHKIIPFLVQKMMEIYRNNHGESLLVFLEAIRDSFWRSGGWTESDSVDELVPMLDLIEAIVINRDLLHSSFQLPSGEGKIDLAQRKWTLPTMVSGILSHCINSANYSRLEFMRRYGRTLLPHLADFIFSKYDGSLPAVRALSYSLEPIFNVIDDHMWTDEVESRSDVAGLKKMLEGGRKLLQHIPFDKLEFAIKEATEHCRYSSLIVYFTAYFSDLRRYCSRVVSLGSPELKDAVVRDVAPALVQHNILPLSFDFVVSSFKDWVKGGEVESVANCLSALRWLLERDHPLDDRLLRFISVLKKDFFSRVGIFTKMINLATAVCDRFEEVFGALRCIIQTDSERWSAEDITDAKSHYKAAEQLLNSFLTEIKAITHLGKTHLEESSKADGSDERLEYVAQIDYAMNRIDGVENSFEIFSDQNSDKTKLITDEA